MSAIDITMLSSVEPSFWSVLARLTAWEGFADQDLERIVAGIIADVRARGDAALLEYSRRFDRSDAVDLSALTVAPSRLDAALQAVDGEQRAALETAAARVRRYHELQLSESWSFVEPDGTRLGQQVTPLDRVGLYVPGGKAAYPSSVLMNAIPAKVAGVGELVMVVPAPDGVVDDMVLAAARVARVDRVFLLGGAQAVAALAYGTETIPRVDKIVGPGNVYVAAAKRQVFGAVGIDMIAGPSEILVVCDGATNPDWIAMDLFSQAEHDENAQAILVSPDGAYLSQVRLSMDRLLADMARADIIRASLETRGAFVQVRDLAEAARVVNQVAPEHLELSVAEPEAMLAQVRNAGAVFLGRHTAEVMGDYCAGPNHVLPTSGTARFSSPLGVYDFQKRSSVIHCSVEGASALAGVCSVLARSEGLTAHARSAEYRMGKP